MTSPEGGGGSQGGPVDVRRCSGSEGSGSDLAGLLGRKLVERSGARRVTALESASELYIRTVEMKIHTSHAEQVGMHPNMGTENLSGQISRGADDGNRTRMTSLEGVLHLAVRAAELGGSLSGGDRG